MTCQKIKIFGTKIFREKRIFARERGRAVLGSPAGQGGRSRRATTGGGSGLPPLVRGSGQGGALPFSCRGEDIKKARRGGAPSRSVFFMALC